MSRTRDIIQEIADKRQRQRFGSAIFELTIRWAALEDAFENHDRTKSELIRYFPVALIACIEGYFRAAIKDLVDSGEPYLANAENLKSSLKLDFTLLNAIHGKAVTVGELVAHGVQLSRLEHINAVLSILIGKGFFEALRTITDRWAHEVKGEPIKPILEEPDKTFTDVARTFEWRHIICHELATAYDIDYKEVSQCFESCASFLRASDELVTETINPGQPLTQNDMNIAAGEELEEKRIHMAAEIAALKTRLDAKEMQAFDLAQEKWEQYCEAWANFVAGDRVDGGTIWPLIFADTAKAVVEQRVAEISGFKRLSEP